MELNILFRYLRVNRIKYFCLHQLRKFCDKRFDVTVPWATKLFFDSMESSQFRGMIKIDVLHLVETGKRARSIRKCSKVPTYIFQSTNCQQRDFCKKFHHSGLFCMTINQIYVMLSELPVNRSSFKFREEKLPNWRLILFSFVSRAKYVIAVNKSLLEIRMDLHVEIEYSVKFISLLFELLSN